jgi:hypothetical protein
VIVAPDPAVRQALTQLIRADLQAQGGIAEESHLAPVLVEQEFSNKKLAANYRKGDEIYYKTGSPTAEGIPNNSAAMVISVNCNKDTTTVETQEGEQISYDPPQLRRQPVESIIYREETASWQRVTGSPSPHCRPREPRPVRRLRHRRANRRGQLYFGQARQLESSEVGP